MQTYKKLHQRTINRVVEKCRWESRGEITEILRKVRIEPEKGCWFIKEDWSIYANFRGKRAHRLIFDAFYPDELTDGLLVCHKCDRPGCVNPEHLFKGTNGDNYRDAIGKGRMTRNRIDYRISLDELRKADQHKNIVPEYRRAHRRSN